MTIDNVARQASSDAGVFMRWSNVQHFHAFVDSPLTFTGTAARDSLTVSTSVPVGQRPSVPLDVAMGGGDDRFSFATGPMLGTIDGGSGDDELLLPTCSQVDYRLDVAFNCRVFDQAGKPVLHRTQVNGWEGRTVVLAGRRASITGTDRADEVFVRAPRIRVAGLGGNDVITVSPEAKADALLLGGPGRDVLTGGRHSDRIYGGAGHDTLIGLGGADLLVGGAGRDKARGGPGRDRCFAEKANSCELPRR